MADRSHKPGIRIEHATVIAHLDEGPGVLRDHSILVEDGFIRALGPSRELANRAATELIDASRHVVLPGLVNTHHHLYQSLTRCMPSAQNAGLFDWLTVLYQKWRHLDYESVKLASQISIGELLLSGCTTTSDHFYLFPSGSDVRIEAVLDAADSMGIRIHACRGGMSVGVSAGGLPPDDCVQDEKTILADCERSIRSFHDPRPGSMRRIDLAPCSPFSVSPRLAKDTAELAREHGVMLHTHAAETLDEERYCLGRFNRRPIEWLNDLGWLGPDVYLAHCVHLSDGDIKLLADTHTGVAHCPCSNMRLGSGLPPVRRLLDARARVGLAVDGSSSNDGGHMLAEARQALLLQRAIHGPGGFTAADAFTLSTRGGAEVLNRPELGDIEADSAADLVFHRKDDIAIAGAIEQDPLGAMMLCHVGRADRVIVNGRTVVKDGRLTLVDEERLVAQFNELVRNRWR